MSKKILVVVGGLVISCCCLVSLIGAILIINNQQIINNSSRSASVNDLQLALTNLKQSQQLSYHKLETAKIDVSQLEFYLPMGGGVQSTGSMRVESDVTVNRNQQEIELTAISIDFDKGEYPLGSSKKGHWTDSASGIDMLISPGKITVKPAKTIITNNQERQIDPEPKSFNAPNYFDPDIPSEYRKTAGGLALDFSGELAFPWDQVVLEKSEDYQLVGSDGKTATFQRKVANPEAKSILRKAWGDKDYAYLTSAMPDGIDRAIGTINIMLNLADNTINEVTINYGPISYAMPDFKSRIYNEDISVKITNIKY